MLSFLMGLFSGTPTSRRSKRPQPRRWRPSLTQLEDRITPSVTLVPPVADATFGTQVVRLATGNIVVTDPGVSSNAGAVYLYNGTTGSLISTLSGSSSGDMVGSGGVVALPNGSFVVDSPSFNSNKGAATWENGTTGIQGSVNSSNSLVGSSAGDKVGLGGIIVLQNGNYVVLSPNWNSNKGAATFSSSLGINGTVSSGNSLIGSTNGDMVGSGGVTLVGSNFVVASPNWNGSRGAATWENGQLGVTGTISSTNSLVGTHANDAVGTAVTVLETVSDTFNYVVSESTWNSNQGAATWGSGTTGVTGNVSVSTSIVGPTPGDMVSSGGVYSVGNGNFVVASPKWNNQLGAATWVSGTPGGLKGTVSSSNSLVGWHAKDMVGTSITVLVSGNFLVGSPNWNNKQGAVTWVNGQTGITGNATVNNSLVGPHPNDLVGTNILQLANGNYVVFESTWNNNQGAATWGSGLTGITGTVTVNNSLVGPTPGDMVSSGGITLLANGNYVVSSPNWNGQRGAATWINGTAGGVKGTVSGSNSLVGTHAGDKVGTSVTVLTSTNSNNSNYVVASPSWNGGIGAATFGSATSGVKGSVSSSNSLVGSAAGDNVGSGGVFDVGNGNYVVDSPNWRGMLGAVTWASGSGGISGTVSSSNSLVGSTAGDQVGSGGIQVLDNGNYVIASPHWSSGLGAATWRNGTVSNSGTLNSSNSFIGSGSGDVLSVELINEGANYIVLTTFSTQGLSMGSDTTALTGTLAAGNSMAYTTLLIGSDDSLYVTVPSGSIVCFLT